MHTLWILLAMLTVAAIAGSRGLREGRLRRGLRAEALTRRMRYTPADPVGLPERYHGLDLVRQGHHRTATHTLFGTSDLGPVSVFCLTCELGLGLRQTVARDWCVVIETHAAWPHALLQAADADRPWLSEPGSATRQNGRWRVQGAGAALPAGLIGSTQALDLDSLGPRACVELQGRWLAVAVPDTGEPGLPFRVLDSTYHLARRLTEISSGASAHRIV